ncbi:ArsR/SmtB family transcription factor [Couchioplanes caeruleus]|uniref:HTH arsR-type domain-containing protein n=2 Tax=Couchioplanes caeruleus TaxID=56438 RepID=A0A1K0GAB4_9ACTN|nr:helix-turn-helix domain-containing protein [Couchioplanes caeruleus]OJF14178.1 hypothetical protein BG844_11005 [Couchioplanes caeruleus subsp. caeruleus]ROP28305.1 DNA-binding transcriptional ArsR family regulator [Couchioplanes caeruleus]
MIGGDTVSMLERAAVVLRATAYEHRLHLLLLLLHHGEQTPAALAERLPIDPSAVAHHLRYLKDARLIRRQRRGRHVYYDLHGEPIRRLVAEILAYAEPAPARIGPTHETPPGVSSRDAVA